VAAPADALVRRAASEAEEEMARVIVAGSINMDVVARTARHPRPGETVAGHGLAFHAGGKGANQAVAAARAGVETLMVGKVGADAFGEELHAFLRENAVDTARVSRVDGTTSGTAVIVVDDRGENTIVVVAGANGLLTPADVRDVPATKGDILISQFETPPETVEAFLSMGRSAGATTMLNPAPAAFFPDGLLHHVDVLVVNETELGFFVGQALSAEATRAEMVAAARKLRADPDQTMVVTLGPAGAVAIAGDRVLEVPGRRVEAADTTGAGDCFVGSLGARLAAGDPLDRSLEFANTAASLCVQRPGAGPSMPAATDVLAAMASDGRS
jgi:ribokinase